MRLAIVSVGLSTAVMIVALATVSGFQNGIREKITSAHGDVIIDDISNVEGAVPIPVERSFEKFTTQLQHITGVEGVYPCLIRPFIGKGKEEIDGMVAKGVDANYDFTFYKLNLIQGKIPDFAKDSNQILISSTTASRLGLKIGNRMKGLFFKTDAEGNQSIKAMNPTIAGIFNSGLDEFDKTFVLTSRKVLRRMTDPEFSFSQWEVKLKNSKDAEKIAYDAVQQLPVGRFNVNTAKKYNRQIFDWLGLLDTNVVIILFLMILVACINMSTTLLILITERTHMVGTLKALGAKNGSVAWIFLYQALIISAGGLLLGNVLGLGFCWLQDKYHLIKLNQETYYVSHVLIDIEPWHLPVVNIGTLLICLLVLFIPSMLIHRMTPVKSMKFE
jgi:lipoprotein-releasing system permease protein